MTESADPRPTEPAVDDAPLMEDHTYDGIQEYDNPLPGWWKAVFWASALFAIPYTVWYHFLDGNTILDAYAAEVAQAEERSAGQERLGTDAATLLALMDDPATMEAGRKVWDAYCFACHLKDGAGQIGPNMTDDHYLTIRRIEDLVTQIENGAIEKGMTPFKGVISDNQIVQVAAFVAGLRGTTPTSPNPKAAEGEVIPPWSAALEEGGAEEPGGETAPGEADPENPPDDPGEEG